MRKRLTYDEWRSISTLEADWLITDMLYEVLERLDSGGLKTYPKPQPRSLPVGMKPPQRQDVTELDKKISELEEKLVHLNSEYKNE